MEIKSANFGIYQLRDDSIRDVRIGECANLSSRSNGYLFSRIFFSKINFSLEKVAN